jgi:hypothetical protein
MLERMHREHHSIRNSPDLAPDGATMPKASDCCRWHFGRISSRLLASPMWAKRSDDSAGADTRGIGPRAGEAAQTLAAGLERQTLKLGQ